MSRQTDTETEKQTDLVLEVALPEVGHLKIIRTVPDLARLMISQS